MVSLRRRCLAVVTLLAVMLCASTPAAAYPLGQTGSAPTVLSSGPLSGVIRAPDGYAKPAAPVPESTGIVAATDGLRAVAVVGDVGSVTATYKQDMDSAVTALEAHGVTVTRFTYGEGSFTWADIVAAAKGAHFLLYMGHGVYWGGTCTNPTSVGGFYLGPGQFVSPGAVYTDLAGRLADDAVIIFSHACYTAGSTACDASGQPGVAEAERRVTLYAEAFTHLGLQAYFANNYFGSAAAIVNRLLDDSSFRSSVGDVFRATYPNGSDNHRDLSYPVPGYDLWLNGSDGNWDHGFVGQPSYVFSGDLVVPELGGLPATLGFLHSEYDHVTTPAVAHLTPANVTTDDQLTWSVTKVGTWFSVAPLSGTTPDGFTLSPGTLEALPPGSYTGAITVSVTDPADAVATPQRIEVFLRVTDGPLYIAYLPAVAKHP